MIIDVLIVDDHPVMRELLRQVLEAYPDISIVAEASNGEEAVTRATQLQPTVAIIDIRLPTMSGIEASKLIKRQSPCTAIIGLTAGEADDTELAMRTAGATAVLNKADVVSGLYSTILGAVKSVKASV